MTFITVLFVIVWAAGVIAATAATVFGLAYQSERRRRVAAEAHLNAVRAHKAAPGEEKGGGRRNSSTVTPIRRDGC